jgi:predicted DCC family thiol-disulfide oxidoreductase YuxK
MVYAPEVSVNEMSEPRQLEVYTDGECPLCRWMRAKVEPLDRSKRIEWLDYRQPQIRAATPFTFEQLDAEMHTRRASDGEWSAGYRAWIEVMRVLPRWRWLAPVLSIWPLTALGPVLYRALAKRRYRLFGVPPPCDADGVCTLHKAGADGKVA